MYLVIIISVEVVFMVKYVELATKGKALVRYELEGDTLGKVEIFKDGDFEKDFEIEEIVGKAVKFGVVSALGRELSEEEARKAVSERLADYLDKASEKRR